MTRRLGRSAANDPGLVALFRSGAPVITLVGKTWGRQVGTALGASLDENLAMIGDSLAESARHVAGMDGANSTKSDPETPYQVSDLLLEQKEVRLS